MDLNYCATVDYQNETNEWNSTGTTIIENMNTFIPENSEIMEVFQIKEDLISDFNETKIEMKDIDISDHKDKITKSNELFKDRLSFFKSQQILVLKKEKDLKDYYDKLEIDIQKLNDFTKFLSDIDTKYKDFEATDVNKTILRRAFIFVSL